MMHRMVGRRHCRGQAIETSVEPLLNTSEWIPMLHGVPSVSTTVGSPFTVTRTLPGHLLRNRTRTTSSRSRLPPSLGHVTLVVLVSTAWLRNPLVQLIETSNPPLALKPLALPSGQFVGNAGRRSMTCRSCDCRSISTTAADAPMLPSIWKTLEYGSLSWLKRLSPVKFTSSFRSIDEPPSASFSRAKAFASHAALQPVEPPPLSKRCSISTRAAVAHSGWLNGPYRPAGNNP
mmetsp:Transcript_18949/g.36653  ORF Transcript_18949/g.36653 Transcript_18949/m.36653 type:complete len:233 (-) Transcript_18949:310-1008(-)